MILLAQVPGFVEVLKTLRKKRDLFYQYFPSAGYQ